MQTARFNVIIELTLLIAVPIILVYFLFPLGKSDAVFLPFVTIVLIRCASLFSSSKMTVEKDVQASNFKRYAFPYAIFALIAMLGAYFLRDILTFPEWLSDDESLWLAAFYTLLQEIVFRTYLLNRLRCMGTSHLVTALISATIFAGFHLILPDAGLMFLLTFIAGFFWSYLYIKSPNLFMVWLSHLLFNLEISLFY